MAAVPHLLTQSLCVARMFSIVWGHYSWTINIHCTIKHRAESLYAILKPGNIHRMQGRTMKNASLSPESSYVIQMYARAFSGIKDQQAWSWNCGPKECTDPCFKGNAHNDRVSNLVPLHPLLSYILCSWILHVVLWNSWFYYMNFWVQSTDSRLFFLLFHRTIQWFGSERTFKDHLIPTPCYGQGHLQPLQWSLVFPSIFKLLLLNATKKSIVYF